MPAEQIVAVAQRRLTASGWQVYEPVVVDDVICPDKLCTTTMVNTTTTLLARRGDTIMNAAIPAQSNGDGTYLQVVLHRAPPPAVVPAGVLGTLLGAALGLLVFGWASSWSSAGPADAPRAVVATAR